MTTAATPDVPAASSPAPVVAPSVNLDAMSPDQRQNWRLTGDAPSTETPAASPAAPADAEQPTSTEALPAGSDPATSGKPDTKPGRTKTKADTEARFQELLSERAELRRRLDALERQQTAPAKTEPTPAQTLAQTVSQPDLGKPALNETAFFEQFPDASWSDFIAHNTNHAIGVRDAERIDRERRDQSLAAKRERFETFAKRVTHTPYLDTLPPPTEFLPAGAPPTPRTDAMQEVMESEHAATILAHLEAHPEEFDAIDACRSTEQVIRLMARLESRVIAPVVAPSKAVSTAPEPPKTLGDRSRTPADPSAAAVADDDFRTYRDVENQRELAEKKHRR